MEPPEGAPLTIATLEAFGTAAVGPVGATASPTSDGGRATRHYVNLCGPATALQRFVDLAHGAASTMTVDMAARLPRDLRAAESDADRIAAFVPAGPARSVPAGHGESNLRRMQWPTQSVLHATRVADAFNALSADRTFGFTGLAWVTSHEALVKMLASGGAAPGLVVRPRLTRAAATAQSGGRQPQWARIARWEGAGWPAGVLRLLAETGLTPEAGSLQTDARGKPALRITPAPGCWTRTFTLLAQEGLEVEGPRGSPHVSWRVRVTPARTDELGTYMLDGVLDLLSRNSPQGYGGAWARETIFVQDGAWVIEGEMPGDWSPAPGGKGIRYRVPCDASQPDAGGVDVTVSRVVRRPPAMATPTPETDRTGPRATAPRPALRQTAAPEGRTRRGLADNAASSPRQQPQRLDDEYPPLPRAVGDAGTGHGTAADAARPRRNTATGPRDTLGEPQRKMQRSAGVARDADTPASADADAIAVVADAGTAPPDAAPADWMDVDVDSGGAESDAGCTMRTDPPAGGHGRKAAARAAGPKVAARAATAGSTAAHGAEIGSRRSRQQPTAAAAVLAKAKAGRRRLAPANPYPTSTYGRALAAAAATRAARAETAVSQAALIEEAAIRAAEGAAEAEAALSGLSVGTEAGSAAAAGPTVLHYPTPGTGPGWHTSD